MAKEFDSILEDVGGYGRYQRMMVYLIIVPTAILIVMQVYGFLFMVVVPDHWCSVPGIENTTMTPEQWKNFTIPWDAEDGSYSSCQHYEITWQQGTPVRSNEIKDCEAWDYDRSLMKETLATTNDWVCDKEIYSAHLMSIRIAGNSLSALVLPVIADKYTGRRPMFFISVTMHMVFSFLAIFAHNFYLQMALRFLSAWSFQTNYQTSYMIVLEFLPPHKRNWAEFVSFVTWACGMSAVSGLCWFLADWRYITLFLVALDVIMWGLWWVLPESPRWLLTQGRVEEAHAIMLKVAKINKASDDVDESILMNSLKSVGNPEENEVSVITVLKYPKFCIRAIFTFLIAGAGFLAVGIISLNIDILPNRYFLNHFLLSLVEVPSNISSVICVQYLGRRFTSIVSYAVSVFISLAAVFLVANKVALLAIAVALKWILVIGIYIIYLQVTEVFPTTLRATGMGALTVFGTAASSSIPYIISSDKPETLKYWVIFSMCILATVCSIAIPETLGLPLPQTLPEAEQLGDNRPLLKWINHWNLDKYSSPQEKDIRRKETKKMLKQKDSKL